MKKLKITRKMDIVTDHMAKVMASRGGFESDSLDLNLSNMNNLPKELKDLEKFKL